jgi:ubiquinone/menaquinone biosynthesis C-methylase UbiE
MGASVEDTSTSRMTLTEVYNRNAGYWDSWLYRAVYYRAYIRLLRMLERDGALGRPVRVLDCGIGAGLLSEALLHIADWHMELNGVDLSSNLLAMSAAKFSDQGAQARLALSDICGLPYRNEQMDLVMSALVLEHVAQPLDAVREMARVLHRGPLLLVATRPGAPDHYFRRKYRYRPYRAEVISDWVKAAGLTKVRAYPFSGIARFFARAYIGTKV